MASQLNLAKFKASGVYIIEMDAGATITLTPTIGRLVVGSSKKGPMNAAALVRNTGNRGQIYGEVDRALENKGSYFHRFIDIMLNEGPVYALNVIPIDMTSDGTNQDQNTVGTYNTESATVNDSPFMTPIKDVFNKQGFWAASDKELNRVKNKRTGALKNKILTFTNTGKRDVTVFVRRAQVNGYDVTAEEWYRTKGDAAEIPSYVHPEDMISDYFVDVIVVEGKWDNYARLAQDPVYFKFFDTSGLKTERIDEFLSVGSVTLINRSIGCLIPDFMDRNDTNTAIDRLFNNSYATTEMFCAIDEDALNEFDFESGDFVAAEINKHRLDIIGHGVPELSNSIDDDENIMIDVVSYRKPISNIFMYKEKVDMLPDDIIFDSMGTYTVVKAYEDSKLYKAWKNGFIKDGDVNISTETGSPTIADVYLNIKHDTEDLGGNDVGYILISGTTSPGVGSTNIIVETVGSDNVITIDNKQSKYMAEIDLTQFDNVSVSNNRITINVSNSPQWAIDELTNWVKRGRYVKGVTGEDERPRMIGILQMNKRVTGVPGDPGYSFEYVITTMATVNGIDTNGSTSLTVYTGIPSYVTELHGMYMPGFKKRSGLLPNGTVVRQQEIIRFISETNIESAIKEKLDIRHIVDSFDGEVTANTKYELTNIAANNGKVFAFLNAPSMEQFEKSVDPSFINPYNGLLSTEFIANGGNLDLNPSFAFSLPQDTTDFGVPIESYAYFTMPYVTIRENNKNRQIPPAAYMSNLFMRKLNGGDQYGVAAGRNGVLTEREIVGLEYDFGVKDREWLEPVGHNLLIRKRGVGTLVMTNNTAYQRVQSALNNAHVRDTLISMSNYIDDLLFNFLFQYNDEITRIRVRSLLENYLDGVVGARGISRYSVQFDGNNNPNEVLEANAGVVDIVVDFPRAIHKFINRITIARVGGSLTASATGFMPM